MKTPSKLEIGNSKPNSQFLVSIFEFLVSIFQFLICSFQFRFSPFDFPFFLASWW